MFIFVLHEALCNQGSSFSNAGSLLQIQLDRLASQTSLRNVSAGGMNKLVHSEVHGRVKNIKANKEELQSQNVVSNSKFK